MANLTETDNDNPSPNEEGAEQAAAAAPQGGDPGGGEGNSTEQDTELQQPTPLPPRTPRISSIADPTKSAYVKEIQELKGQTTKVIQTSSYRLKQFEKSLPEINRVIAEKHSVSGPIVVSLMSKILSTVEI